jgi:RNA polymerase sigma-70 factor, ECF subfamily
MERALFNPLLAAESRAVASAVDAEPIASADSNLRLAALLRDHFQVVWRAVRRFGVPPRSADDAAQEVFIIAAAKLQEIESGRERQFLYGVAVRVASNFRRGAIFQHEGPGEVALMDQASVAPSAEMLLEQKRQRELLDLILDGLTHDLRTAFVLFELEGLSVPEIADALSIPAGTVASRLRRAREQFSDAVRRVSGRLR